MPKVNKKLLERRIRLTNDFTALEKRYLLTTIGVDDNGDVMPFLNPSNEDFGMMLCSAVRYALGRMSYIVIWIGLRDAIQAEIQRRKDDRGVE